MRLSLKDTRKNKSRLLDSLIDILLNQIIIVVSKIQIKDHRLYIHEKTS